MHIHVYFNFSDRIISHTLYMYMYAGDGSLAKEGVAPGSVSLSCCPSPSSGGLRTGTPIPEHDFSCNFSHHISRTLHYIDKNISPEDSSTLSLTAN